jgi:multiple sugar transport system permease protein
VTATATATQDRERSSPGVGTAPAGLSDRARKERRLGWMLSAPAVIIMLAVTAYPMLNALYLSLFNYRLTDPGNRTFLGLRNYRVILTDHLWWQAVSTTLIITVVTVSIELVIGFIFALVMHRIIGWRRTVRTAILLPYGIITVVSAYAWRYMFESDSGFINSWFHLGTFNWFGHRWSSLLVICFSEIWKTTPFIALLLLAGLAQVPDVLQEAASVDGATAWQRLRKVTLPNMKAAIMVAALFRSLAAWAIFDNIFIMTAGAQNTESVSFLTFRETVQRVELGLGSALSVLLFLSVVLLAFLFIKGFKVNLASVRSD